MTKIALVYLRSALRGYDARVVNTVHDEIVVAVIAEQAEAGNQIVAHGTGRAGERCGLGLCDFRERASECPDACGRRPGASLGVGHDDTRHPTDPRLSGT